jgi:hypothetical protein
VSQPVCRRCGTPFAAGHMYCGECGASRAEAEARPAHEAAPAPEVRAGAREAAPAPGPLAPGAWPGGGGQGGGYQAVRPGSQLGEAFFSHETTPPPDAGVMSDATRYLCAAAYLSPQFANRVIDHLVASHRAVAPSRGIDVEPIVRHCLKARRMQLTRDILLSLLLLAGLILVTLPLIGLLVVTFFLSVFRGANWGRMSVDGRRVAGMTGAAIIGVIVAVLAVLFIAKTLASASSPYGGGSGVPLPSLFPVPLLVILSLAYLVLVGGTLLRYTYVRDLTLVEWLSPGATAPPFERQSGRVESRIAEVSRAQHGNLTLYDLEDPFIGTGITPFNVRRDDERVWSIAIELSRKGAQRRLLNAAPRGEVHVDPVELHAMLRGRLLELNDPALPVNQRVLALSVDDQVVGEGRFRWGSPLIDPDRLIPFSHASRDAIEALICNPQAGLRYYQRVSVSDEGQAVLVGPRSVIGSVDQEVIISAFVYVAVEGHMFYLQFVPASLAPVADHYHIIDRLPKPTSGKFLLKVLLDTASSAFRTILGAPGGVWRTWRLMRKEHKQFTREITYARDYAFADVGARLSVRELGSALRPRTYIQRLDASKYTQIIERLVIETVLDYLESKDVDTTSYRARAEAIYNSGIIVAGNVSGNAAVNTGSGLVQQGSQPVAH